MTISKEERAELRELVASVTPPLPWKSDSDGVIVSDLYEFVADCDGTGGDFIDPKPAKLIAGAVNAAPKLLDALDAADERIAGLEARNETLLVDAATKIESLKARIAELEAAAQWRPIEEAPKDQPVLWLLPNPEYDGEDEGPFFIPTMLCWNKSTKSWWYFDSDGELEDEIRTEDLTGYFLGVPPFPERTPNKSLPLPALPEGGV